MAAARVDSPALRPPPSVTQPALLRTWIRGYHDDNRALFDARYVFHLAGELTITGADVAPAARQPAPALPLPTTAP